HRVRLFASSGNTPHTPSGTSHATHPPTFGPPIEVVPPPIVTAALSHPPAADLSPPACCLAPLDRLHHTIHHEPMPPAPTTIRVAEDTRRQRQRVESLAGALPLGVLRIERGTTIEWIGERDENTQGEVQIRVARSFRRADRTRTEERDTDPMPRRCRHQQIPAPFA